MSWEAITAIATSVAASGVIYGFWVANRNLREEKYAKYVERYQGIFTHLPYGIFNESDGETDEKAKTWLVAYIDLCAEELFDKQRNMIDKKVWKDWTSSILHNFHTPRLSKVFDENKESYPCLSRFIDTGKVPRLEECEDSTN